MRLLRIGIANVNSTVGACTSNASRVVGIVDRTENVDLLVFPEQVLGGYAAEDLVQWRAFVKAQTVALWDVAKSTTHRRGAIAVGLTVECDGGLYNAAAMVKGGKILGIVPKEKLPTYGVFYEGRTMTPGFQGLCVTALGDIPFGDLIFDLGTTKVALEVCEDIWSPDGPMRRRCYQGAEVVLNLSASPFRVGMSDTRREMLATRSADNQAVVAYANLVGGNDGLVFDGGGYVVQNGRVVLEKGRFEEGFDSVVVDLDRTARLRTENTTWRSDKVAFLAGTTSTNTAYLIERTGASVDGSHSYPLPENKSFFLPAETARPSVKAQFCDDVLDALALGIGDYYTKTSAFKAIGVALSGGRDSLLCLILAYRYFSRKPVRLEGLLHAFYMPTRFSSIETRAAAEAAAREFGARFVVSDIDTAFEEAVASAKGMLPRVILENENLRASGISDELYSEPSAMAKQNIQARIRAERMWTWSNSTSGMVLQTSNMSEKAVGYTTIGGDMEGSLSVIANVPKMVVNYLLDYLLETTKSEAIRLTLKKPASAELAEGMEDEKDLMPFPVLDACFGLYAGEKMSPTEVLSVLLVMFPEHNAGVLDGWVKKFERLFTGSIYKWAQSPIGLHIGNLDLDRERALQLPVVQKTEWA